MADCFPKLTESDLNKKTNLGSNHKRVIKLGYRKISLFLSVSQVNYLPQPSASENNCSALSEKKNTYFAQPRPIIGNFAMKSRICNHPMGYFHFF